MENINECTKSKSVLDILGPVAQHIVSLKVCQHTVAYDEVNVLNLLKLCEGLQSACSHLIEQLSIAAKQNNDEGLAKAVKETSETLKNALIGLTKWTDDLQEVAVTANSNNDSWNELVKHLEELMKILTTMLLAWDHSQLRRINSALDDFEDTLNILNGCIPIEKLLLTFKDTISKASAVFSLISERSDDICSRPQREMLHILCFQLHSMFRLLSSVIANCAAHSGSKQLKTNRSCVLSRMLNIIAELRSESAMGTDSYDLQCPAKFINTIDDLFDIIKSLITNSTTNQSRSPLLSCVKVIKGPMEVILKYSVGLAQCCSQQDSSAIMSACENVLHQMKVLSDFENGEKPDLVDIEVTLEVISDVLEVLELKVNTTLIRLIVQALSDPFETLEKLLFLLPTNELEGGVNSSAEDVDTKLSSFTKDFENELDTICQIGYFVIACIGDIHKARKIESSLAVLEWLESILIPTIISACRDHHPHLYINASTLAKHWVSELVNFRNIIDLTMDQPAFCLVTKQEIHHTWAELREVIDHCEHDWLIGRVRKVSCLTRRVLTLDRASLFLYDSRREEIKAAFKELRKYEELMNTVELNEAQRKSLLKRVQLVLTILSHLAETLNQEYLLRSECEEIIFGHDLQSRLQQRFSDTQKKILESSCIEDIPVDIRSPDILQNTDQNYTERKPEVVKAQNIDGETAQEATGGGEVQPVNSPAKEKSLRLTMRTPSEELRARIIERGIKRQLFRDSNKSGENEANKAPACNSSIEISKFLLSPPLSTVRNSTRGSKRNFSLRVREMNLNIGDILNLENSKNKASENGNRRFMAYNPSADGCGKWTQTSLDNFTEILQHMKTLTGTLKESNDGHIEMRRTYAGDEASKIALNYNSCNVLFPEHQGHNSVNHNSHTAATNSSSIPNSPDAVCKIKIFCNSKQSKSSVELSEGSEKLAITNGTQLNSNKDLIALTEKIGHQKMDSAPLSNSLPVSSNSSINITTEQRLTDLKAVHKRLAALKAMFS